MSTFDRRSWTAAQPAPSYQNSDTAIRVANSIADLMQVVAIRAAVFLADMRVPGPENTGRAAGRAAG
jgi:hypothetical protein